MPMLILLIGAITSLTLLTLKFAGVAPVATWMWLAAFVPLVISMLLAWGIALARERMRDVLRDEDSQG
jgi:hypothetical protein